MENVTLVVLEEGQEFIEGVCCAMSLMDL